MEDTVIEDEGLKVGAGVSTIQAPMNDPYPLRSVSATFPAF